MAGPPIWAVGQDLTASDVNTWLIPTMAVKTVDTARTSTTSATADPELTLAVAANATYQFALLLHYTGGTNGASDAQFGLSAPSGSTGFSYCLRNQISGLTWNAALLNTFGGVVNAGTNGTSNPVGFIAQGSLKTSSTAGQLACIWSQNTSSGTATTVKTGSYLIAQRIT
jgi:hypothetical protein